MGATFTLYHMLQQKDDCTEVFIIIVSNTMEPLWLETVDSKSTSWPILYSTSKQTAAGYAHDHSGVAADTHFDFCSPPTDTT